MAFTKGTSGNPKGKPKGAVNAVTADVRDTIKAALEGVDSKTLSDKMALLEPKDFIDAYTKLAEFVTPKLARTQLAAEAENGGRISVTLNLGGPAKDGD